MRPGVSALLISFWFFIRSDEIIDSYMYNISIDVIDYFFCTFGVKIF